MIEFNLKEETRGANYNKRLYLVSATRRRL